MNKNADVVVIGGGIVGSACAYFLAEAGAKVLIVERDALGSGASGHGAGAFGVSLHWVEPPEHSHFIRKAVRFLKWMAPQIAEETGVDILLREMSWLEVARTEATWEYMQEWAPKMDQKMLSADEVMRLEPRLAPPVLGGAIQEGTGQLDSYRMTLAYAKGAELRGAQVFIAEATGLEKSGGRVTGVRTSKGLVGCDSVVLAMGAWTRQAEQWAGFPLPVDPLKGELLTLKYREEEYWPYWISSYDVTNGEELPIYLHRRANGLVYAGTTAEPGFFDNIPTDKARRQILERAVRLMPCIAEAELVEHLGGPRPNPQDGVTILGPVPTLQGLYAATTLPGIMCSAFMGRIVTDLVFKRPLPLPIDFLNPERFSRPVEVQYGWHRLVKERSM